MKGRRSIFDNHIIIFLLMLIIIMLSFSLFGCKTSETLPTTTTTAAGTTTTTAAGTTTTAAGTTTTTAVGTTTTTTTTTTSTPIAPLTFSITSSAFTDGGAIPTECAYRDVTGGQNTSIPLEWQNAPTGTQSFAIAMVDSDANDFVHWLVIDIPVATSSLAEGASPSSMPAHSTELNNDFTPPVPGYGGPSPPQGGPDHEYVTVIFALDTTLSLSGSVTYAAFENAISGHILGQASITGTFSW